MEAHVSVCRVVKRLWHGGKNLKAEGAPQLNGCGIRFDDRIELHRPVAICACLVQNMAAQRPARALPTPGRMDNKASIGNVRPGSSRIHPARARASVLAGSQVRVSPAVPTSFKIGQIADQSWAVASRITMQQASPQPALICEGEVPCPPHAMLRQSALLLFAVPARGQPAPSHDRM
jgi:hypothetical protein